MKITTGCNRTLPLKPTSTPEHYKPAIPIDNNVCAQPTKLGAAATYEEIVQVCKDCPFGLHPVELPAEAQAVAAPPNGLPCPVCREPQFETPSAPPTVITASPSVVPAGYFPARTIPVEQIVSPVNLPAETFQQPLPPPSVPSLAREQREHPQSFAVNLLPVGDEPLISPEGIINITFEDMLQKGEGGLVERTPIEKLLEAALPWWTSGGSLMGWSKLKEAALCMRGFFWKYVLGLRLKAKPNYIANSSQAEDDAPIGPSEGRSNRGERLSPLDLGILVHACIEAFYRTGSFTAMWAPADAIQKQWPAYAVETRRLVQFYLRRYNEDEARFWDMRAVERESRYYFPARRCGGKRRSLCVSARHDGIYRKLGSGEARVPVGEPIPNDSARIHEVKTTATLTYNRLRGFYQDAQLMTNLLTYNHGHAVQRDGTVLAVSTAELFGLTQTVTVTWIGKNKALDLNKDIDRVDYLIPADRVVEFAGDMEDWLYHEIGDRLFSEHCQRPETWRKSWLGCKDQYFPGAICPFLSLCELPGANWNQLYEQRARDILDPTTLEKPKHLAKLEKAKAKAAATVEAK